MSSLHNLSAVIGSILQDIIQLGIFFKHKCSYSLSNGKTFSKFLKIMLGFVLIVVLKVDFPQG